VEQGIQEDHVRIVSCHNIIVRLKHMNIVQTSILHSGTSIAEGVIIDSCVRLPGMFVYGTRFLTFIKASDTPAHDAAGVSHDSTVVTPFAMETPK
jgi:hypothetical protein